MGTYNDLTQEDKDRLASFDVTIRPILGELARLNNGVQVVRDLYYGGVGAILAGLDANEIVPNSTGLAGTIALEPGELTNLMSYLDGVFAYHTEAHQQLIIKACGPENMLRS